MIVLDEHLIEENLKAAIARWYPGQVTFIKTVRPRTHIDDDAIPTLLRQLKQPTFVTINWDDFWKVQPADNRFCMICFTIEIDQTDRLPEQLRQVLKLAPFKTKNSRMGLVARVIKKSVRYYRTNDPKIYTLSV